MRSFSSGAVFSLFLFGILHAAPLERVPNTSLANMPVVPGSLGYTFTNAFPSLVFTNPVCIKAPPGETNRLFVLEKSGRIIVITNLAAPTRSVFLDMTARVTTTLNVWDERGLLGVAFHPGYATNGYFYVFYTGQANTSTGGGGSGLHDVLARYQVSGDTNQANPSSHLTILQQFDEASNHNGGEIHFGAEGYLYVSLGDEGDANDSRNNSQTITKDFFSAFLRLDVDKRPGNLQPNPHHAITSNYLVPSDNPFVGATSFNGVAVDPVSVRTEFWAVGLRNPWRWSFDRETGVLYCGDVGQANWEELNLVERGRNYGWAYREGYATGPKAASTPPGFVHSPPLIVYGHTNGNQAITGGLVYRGQIISQLYGAYVYADYNSGVFWALRHSGNAVLENKTLFADPGGVSAFGADPSNGDLLYCDLQGGQNAVIKRIIYNSTFMGSPIPSTLADTGAFTNLATLGVAPGIVGYDLNVPFWSDNAQKSRWFSVPDISRDITFGAHTNWSFPQGTVWIKHFEMEITNGIAASRRRLETRLLIANTDGGYGVTYRWTTPPTNALLIAEGGENETITTYTANGAVAGSQTWRYPSRVECMSCHTPHGGFALGFNSAQLNRDFPYVGGVTNQIEALSQAGYFSNTVSNRHLLRALVTATNSAASLEFRARSYLAANCVQCHQPEGTSQAFWDARISTPGPTAGIVNGKLKNQLGNPHSQVVAPGYLTNSMLFQRVANLGPGHMPPLATSVIDTQAVQLLSAWITNALPLYQSYDVWQVVEFGSSNAPDAAMFSDPDGDLAKNYLEYLTGTEPSNPLSAWKISISRSVTSVQIQIPQKANRSFELQTTSDVLGSGGWSSLNVPANAPFFPSLDRTVTLQLPVEVVPKYYRARVVEP